MKKIMMLFAFLFATSLFAQVETRLVIADTCSNSQTKTGYVSVPREAAEVIFVVHAKGEADLDSLHVTEGWYDGTANAWSDSGAGTTLTINVADGVYASQAATTLSDFEGANIYKVELTSASSGNDATDPNSVKVYAQFYK